MTTLERLLPQPFVHALGWALLHFIWQGAVVAFVAAGVLFILEGYDARLRYGVALGALLLMPLLVIFTTWRAWTVSHEIAVYLPSTATIRSSAPIEGASNRPAATHASHSALPSATSLESTSSVASPKTLKPSSPWAIAELAYLLPWVFFGWLMGVLALSLRLACGWTQARSLTRRGTSPVSSYRCKRLAELCRQIRISRPVKLLESALIEVPTVIGWLRPVVLLPASTLICLTPAQLETVLLHELAHIRRNDYLINLLQTVVETLLFYHPAVWWLGKRVWVERENCCDDIAVDVCGDPILYARALTELERLRSVAPRQLAMAANNGSLLTRIRRIVNPPMSKSDRAARRVASVFVGVTLFAIGLIVYFAGESIAVADSKQTEAPSVVAESERHPDELIAALRDNSKKVRRQAAETLTRISNQATVITVVEVLGEDSGMTRFHAAYALHAIPEQAAIPPLIDALEYGSEAMRLHAAYALTYIPDHAAVPALIEGLSDESEKIRLQSAYALSYIPDASAIRALASALGDPSPLVRQQAAYALGKIGDSAATDALIVALADALEQVRQQAAHALARIGNRNAVPALIGALRDPFEQVRLQAAYALGRMPDRAAVPVLIEALRDTSERVRQQAAYALGQIGDGRAIPALRAALRDESEPVRRQAAEALNRLQG